MNSLYNVRRYLVVLVMLIFHAPYLHLSVLWTVLLHELASLPRISHGIQTYRRQASTITLLLLLECDASKDF